jgi:hypothetical protein
MLLTTTFVELRVVAGRSRTQAGRSHAVSGRPMLMHKCHAMPMPRCAVALISHFQNGMVVAWHGRGMAYVNQTGPHCVNQIGKTQSKPLAVRHGRGTAWYVWISLTWPAVQPEDILIRLSQCCCFVTSMNDDVACPRRQCDFCTNYKTYTGRLG